MPDYAVNTTFFGRDRVSHVFNEMGNAAGRFENRASGAMRGVGRSADHASTALRNVSKHGYNFGAIVKGILAANAIRGGIGYVTGGLQKVGSDFLEYGDTITGAVARLDGADLSVKGFGKSVTDMSLKVRTAMKGTRYSLTDGAKAFDELAKAGYNKDDALGILPSMVNLATATGVDLATATEMSSLIQGNFGLYSKNSAEQSKMHDHLNDMLARATQLSKGGYESLYETFKTVGPITAQKGLTPEKTFAMALALDKGGIMREEAGTAIKRGLLNFYGPKVPMLRASGIEPFNPDGSRRDPIKLYSEFGRIVGKLKPELQEIAYYNMFGLYGMAGNTKLTAAIADMETFYEKMKNVNGVAKEQAKLANSSPLAKMKIVGNALMNKSFDVLDQYTDNGKNGLDTLLTRIENFDPKPLITALSTTGQALWGLYKIAEPFIPFLPQLVGAFLGYKGVMLAVNAATFIASRSVWGISAALLSGLGPVGAMTTAMGALLSPLALVAATFAAAFASASALYSLFTGKDNAISQWAQDLGIVPKLRYDSEGKVIGYADDAQTSPAGPNDTEATAATARAQRGEWRGRLDVAAPPGTTVSQQSRGISPFELNMLGVNP